MESVHIQFMGMNQKCVLIFNQIPSATVMLKLRNPRLENICVISFFFLKLYIIVLVLPNIKMNPPQVYMCSPS